MLAGPLEYASGWRGSRGRPACSAKIGFSGSRNATDVEEPAPGSESTGNLELEGHSLLTRGRRVSDRY